MYTFDILIPYDNNPYYIRIKMVKNVQEVVELLFFRMSDSE